MEFHSLQEATVDTVHQVELFSIFDVSVEAQASADLVLDELPAKHFETDHRLGEVLLDRLVEMTANSR